MLRKATAMTTIGSGVMFTSFFINAFSPHQALSIIGGLAALAMLFSTAVAAIAFIFQAAGKSAPSRASAIPGIAPLPEAFRMEMEKGLAGSDSSGQ
jgi:hypothetical protein